MKRDVNFSFMLIMLVVTITFVCFLVSYIISEFSLVNTIALTVSIFSVVSILICVLLYKKSERV